jgi:hypothetical protein
MPSSTVTKRRSSRKRADAGTLPAALPNLTPLVEAEAPPDHELVDVYRPCKDLDDANNRLREKASAIFERWAEVAQVVNDVAERKLYHPPFDRLNDWINSSECVINKSQAHACRRALRLHSRLVAEGKETLPSLTHYRIATEGAPEAEWVERGEAIRGMSTREAEGHLKTPKSEEQLALEALVRAAKACDKLNPAKALDGLAASDDPGALIADVKRAAEILLNIYKQAREAHAEEKAA